MKRFLHISLIILFVLAISVLMGFIVYEHGRQNIDELKIYISKKENGGFLNERIISRIVRSYDSIDTVKVRNFNALSLEEAISQNPFVENVDAYLGINRGLIINIEEREALLRVFLPDQRSFYIDKNGVIFPLCDYFTPRTLIANGYIKTPVVRNYTYATDTMYAESDLPGLYLLAKKIIARPFLRAEISQIYKNSKGKYDLIPEVGHHTVRLGRAEEIDNKLDHLEAFYKEKLPKEGWDKYKIINLEYKNQIVCIKK